MGPSAPHSTPAGQTPKNAEELASYARSLDCIHCGLCLNTCPTYRLTGSEAASPRGRIHLMRAVAEERLVPDAAFAEDMDSCLVCRHCESVCPAGVEFGALMEFTRDAWLGPDQAPPRGLLGRLALRGGLAILERRWALKLSAFSLGLIQTLRLDRLAAPLLGARGTWLRNQPLVPSSSARRPLPAVTQARGEREESAAMLAGCALPELLADVQKATARSLSRCGIDVHCPPGHTCCGALHAHNGDLTGARRLARETIASFEPLHDDTGQPLPIVVNSAGCGAHMAEYDRLLEDDHEWRERAAKFARRVVDYSVFLSEEERFPRFVDSLDSEAAAPLRLAYDDPCHLCHGQQVRDEPRKILDALPGAQRVELRDSESCCGSAGIYSALHPEDSQEILEPKLEALRDCGAETLVTANPGCHLHIATGLRRDGRDVRVAHVAELVDEAQKEIS